MVLLGFPSYYPSKGSGIQKALSCTPQGAGRYWESPRLTVTWAFVQLPSLSYVSLAEPHTLANGWPDAIVVSTREDGV